MNPASSAVNPVGSGSGIAALLAGEGLPEFAAITPDQVREHIPVLLADLNTSLGAIEAQLDEALRR